MKKLLTVVIILMIAFGCFANGGVETVEMSNKVTVRLLTDATGIDDKSFNAAAWRGILSYYGETWENTPSRGTLYDVITASGSDAYIPNLKNAADEGYDLIIVTGFTWASALGEVAPLYPNQKFLIVDVDWVGQPNVLEAMYKEDQGSYLVGVIAAEQAISDGIKNPKFGFIGGVPGAVITKFEMGYIQGIKSILPNAEILDYYANSWGAPEMAKAQSKNWYDNGVYCIFSAAGGTGNGTIAQAKEYRLAGKNVWAIGVDSDQYEMGLYTDKKSAVLTSMLKLVETSTEDTLKNIANDTFKSGVAVYTLADGGVGYSAVNDELSETAVNAAEKARKAIIAGDITVYGRYDEAVKAGVVEKKYKALDD